MAKKKLQEAFATSSIMRQMLAEYFAEAEQIAFDAAEMLAASFCEVLLQMDNYRARQVLQLLLEAEELTEKQQAEITRLLDL